MSENLFNYHIQSLYGHLLDLTSEIGINASGRDEVYGCLFGRDSALTILQILQSLDLDTSNNLLPRNELLDVCRKTLLTLVELQGQTVNIESGEEPGKFIHEYRVESYDSERLRNINGKPWYIYPDGILRNYDSIDSTPLVLIALFRYYQATGDNAFLLTVQPAVERALNWIISYGDRDKDFLLEYELPVLRKSGGLPVQSWTDSLESVLRPDGTMPLYPIAPVEVQGYAWLALTLWSDWYISQKEPAYRQFSQRLITQARGIKNSFNKLFIMKEETYYLAQALDGEKQQIKTITGNPLIILWATNEKQRECILEEKYIPSLVHRSFQPDLYDSEAGIRTMSVSSPTYNADQNSYHN
jgi:glycogen debranching enzyme